MQISKWFGVAAATVTICALPAAIATESASVTGFMPSGTVKGVRQVRASFSEPIVPFGDPRGLVDPFDIDCPAKGAARWADQKNWIMDFDQDLPAGVKCRFTLKSGLQALSGHALSGQREFAFSTGGPSVKNSKPWNGSKVREDQVFVLTLDAKPDEATVLAHTAFQVEGLVEPIPVKIISGAMREEILKSDVGNYAYWHRPRKLGNHGVFTERPPEWLVIQPARELPSNRRVKLVWGKGIESLTHVATEHDQTLGFQIREPFTAQFTCERENPNAGCIPFLPLAVHFSSEIPAKLAAQVSLVDSQGHAYVSNINADSSDPSHVTKLRGKKYRVSRNGEPEEDADATFSDVSFAGPFPENAKLTVSIPSGMKDEAGRALINQSSFPLATRTDGFPPLAKFAADFGLVEAEPEAVVPVTLRNLEPEVKARLGLQQLNRAGGEDSVDGQIIRVDGPTEKSISSWIGKVRMQGMQYHGENEPDHRAESILDEASQTNLEVKNISIPKPNGPKAFEVVGIPLPKPGFYIVQLESRLLGKHLLEGEQTFYVSTAALVTNLAVHFKWGRESSLAWVTSLDKGVPVAGAAVAVRDGAGKLYGKGKSDSDGIVRLPGLPDSPPFGNENGYSELNSGLFVSAEKGDDFTFDHTSWNRGIETWRYQLPSAFPPSPKLAHTVFDRTLFRAGETVHMKHYLRIHTMAGFAPVEGHDLPKLVQLRHLGSDQKYELPLKWTTDGVAESTWSIPKAAKLGTYEVRLLMKSELQKSKGREEGEDDGEEEGGYHYNRYENSANELLSGSFRVEEFRIPLMKGRILGPKDPAIGATSLPVDLAVEYLAGGGAGLLPVQVRYQQLVSGATTFPDFDGYSFDAGKYTLPANEAGAPEASFHEDGEEDAGDTAPSSSDVTELRKLALNLDATGTARADLKDLHKLDRSSQLSVELEYRDPNGEVQTSSNRIPLYPASRLVGIKPDSWYASVKDFKFTAAVVDLKGHPITDAPVEAEFLEQVTTSHRKRLIGGFYSYENHTELKDLGKACAGKTDSHGVLICEAPPPHAGNLVVQVATKDEQGNPSYSYSSTWVYDSDRWWFAQDDSERMDILPERKRYESGETATFQVRMPFAHARALVTVEREGVIDAFVADIDGAKALVDVPIKPAYAPNVFVSVLAVRGRAGEIQPTALVDLGKPAYKLGIAELNVGWKPHELKVAVSPDHEVYRVRDKARVKIKVERADGGALPEDADVALAAVDEGLLLLKPNDSWKLLDAMMSPRGYEVETSTAQMQVVGKRHFGLKALPTGGDGGKAPTRELFDSLLIWKGHVKLDANGEATVEIPINDSLTSFRVAAIAGAGLGYFGAGSALIRTTQDFMLFSGIPPLVREGDRTEPEFTLRNTTATAMSVALKLTVDGLGASPQPESKTVELAPNEAKTIAWSVEVPSGITSLAYDLEAHAGKAADRIKVSQKVVPAVPVKVFQATLSQLEASYKVPIERPHDAIPGRGGVHVVVQPTLLTALDGVRDLMREYPYDCLEQKVSVAVALRDSKRWEQVAGEMATYLDNDGLARYFPISWILGSDTLTSYVLSIADEAGWKIPMSARSRMLEGLKGFVEGRIIRGSGLATADLTIRKLAAIEALARYDRAQITMLGSIEIDPNLWPTSAVIDWLRILRRLPAIPDSATKLGEAEQVLRSRLNFQGTILGFSTESTDRLWWLMVSGDENANRMLLSVLDIDSWHDDVGRLARGAVYRQKKGAWDTTTANAWGVLAYEKFAAAFEKEPVTGQTTGSLGGKIEDLSWASLPGGATLKFPWPDAGSGDLTVSHSGTGKPWITLQSLAAIPLKTAFSSGYRISKSWTAVERKDPKRWSRGDIVRVRLDLDAQSDMTWVVVDDPIPAGATILGGGLGNDSALSTRKETGNGSGEARPAFEERAFDGYRAYYEFVPKGAWSVEYTVRLNQAGTMGMPPTRVEAMYAPEMFGEAPNATVEIAE